MARDCITDSRAIAIDQIEDPLRHTGLFENLSEYVRTQRSDFARLQDHGAAGRERGCDFAADLIDRPVPGRDEPAHAYRLAAQLCGANHLLELEVLQNGERGC